jgi:hypothetical protein
MWQDTRSGLVPINDYQRALAGQAHIVVEGQRQPLSVPCFPWYY